MPVDQVSVSQCKNLPLYYSQPLNPGRSLTENGEIKMFYLGLANSGLRQAKIGQALVGYLP
jgi:hypothetical protein